MNRKCYWLGHTGTDTESGYHICSRCGLHEYWDSVGSDQGYSADYLEARKLFAPYDWLRVKAWRMRYKLEQFVGHIRLRIFKNEIPF